MATKKKETLLNCSVVAHILDVSPDDVMDLARKRELTSEKQGQHWKFSLADVMAYKKKMEK